MPFACLYIHLRARKAKVSSLYYAMNGFQETASLFVGGALRKLSSHAGDYHTERTGSFGAVHRKLKNLWWSETSISIAPSAHSLRQSGAYPYIIRHRRSATRDTCGAIL
jgi:hypothetical protein